MLAIFNFFKKIHIRITEGFIREGEYGSSVKIGIMFISLYLWIIQVIYCFSIGLPIDSMICLAAVVLISIALTMYKYTNIHEAVVFNSIVFVTVFAILAANFNAGMQVNPTMMFFCVVPLFGIPLTGFKRGVLWTFLSIGISMISMFLANKLNYSWNELNPDQWFNVGLTNLFTGPVLTLGIFGYYYLANKKLSQKLVDNNKKLSSYYAQKEKLLRIITHDVSRNVALLSSNLELLKENEKIPSDYDFMFGYIYNIKNILLNSTALDQQNKSNLGVINVENLIELIQIEHKEYLEYKKLLIKVNVQEKFMVPVNKESFKINVLGNLISNAIKFSNKNSSITVSVFTNKIEIENTGLKFSPRTNVPGRGSGFGLPIVREFSAVNGLDFNISANGDVTTATISKN